MDNDPFRYDTWIEEALRGVIRRTLRYAAEDGLPGDHHFYITYRTDAEGVEMPGYLSAEHPDEMTIVLQHQFEDLVVNEDALWVTLRFNGKPERLRIPFDALVSFADPSVNFGLQIKVGEGMDAEGGVDFGLGGADNRDDEGDASRRDAAAARPRASDGTGEVIALDTFRKK